MIFKCSSCGFECWSNNVKGLEADMVFLFNNHSSITETEILDRGDVVIDAEKRVYYVGMTRARETLVFVDNFFDTYVFDLSLQGGS
jgi:superfamily I DNA/RNA helicase